MPKSTKPPTQKQSTQDSGGAAGYITLMKNDAEVFRRLAYKWTAGPDEDAQRMLTAADQLLRRIYEQVRKIDHAGHLWHLAKKRNETGLPGQIDEPPNMLSLLALRSFTTRLERRYAVFALFNAVDQVFKYIQDYLVDAKNIRAFGYTLSHIERQLVNGGLRYRLHALMKVSFFVTILALVIFCGFWLTFTLGYDFYNPAPEPNKGQDVDPTLKSLVDIRQLVVAFLSVAIGVFAGRFLYIFMSKPSGRDTFQKFYMIEMQLETPFSEVMVDGFLAYCATVLFASGIVVISIGGGAGEAAFSTEEVMDKVYTALGVGVLIGLARQQFMIRLRTTAEQTLGPRDPNAALK